MCWWKMDIYGDGKIPGLDKVSYNDQYLLCMMENGIKLNILLWALI